MGRLIDWRHLLVLMALVIATRPAPARPLVAWDGPVAEAAARFGIPVPWIRQVIRIESAGQTMRDGRPIRSRVGAMGLMQLMPDTWEAMRRAHGLGSDPDNPRDNILAGTAYLRAMYDKFGYPGLFAAYNAGPARYADYLARGRRLPAETVAYVAQVTSGEGESIAHTPITSRTLPSGAFVVNRADRRSADPLPVRAPSRQDVFFALSGGAT